MDIAPKLKGLLEMGADSEGECEEGTAATDALATLEGDVTDSDDEDGAEDFGAENDPRPPPREIMYGGQGKHTPRARTATSRPQSRGRRKRESGARGHH